MDRQSVFSRLREVMISYAPLSDSTWRKVEGICTLLEVDKHEHYVREGSHPDSFGFVYSGLLRVYTTTEHGDEYNKIFFPENTFPGAMAALLTGTPSAFAIQALEPTSLVKIDFKGYRSLLAQESDLKTFQIHYLEQHWLLKKEPREVAFVQQDATERYLTFLREYPDLEQRLAQYHIASHLGITPTQLSRIRKKMNHSNPSSNR